MYSLAVVVLATTTDRGWSSHVLVTGPVALEQRSSAMTEQFSRTRITGSAGSVDTECLRAIRAWIALHLGVPSELPITSLRPRAILRSTGAGPPR